MDSLNVPTWFAVAHMEDRMPTGLLKVAVENEVVLPAAVEDFDQLSSFLPSEYVRRQTYGILLEGAEQRGVSEYTTKGRTIICKPVICEELQGILHSCDHMPLDEKRRWFLRLTGLDKSLPPEMEFSEDSLTIFYTSLISWVQNCKVPEEHFVALCLTAWCLHNRKGKYSNAVEAVMKRFNVGTSTVIVVHRSAHKLKRNKPMTGLCIRSMHVFAQWQGCLQSLCWLNSVLNFPYPTPRFERLFSGKTAYNIAQNLRNGMFPEGSKGKSLFKNANLIFETDSEAANDFCAFLGLLEFLVVDPEPVFTSWVGKSPKNRKPVTNYGMKDLESGTDTMRESGERSMQDASGSQSQGIDDTDSIKGGQKFSDPANKFAALCGLSPD